jgi:hypothetical protein
MCERVTGELGIQFLDLDHEAPIDFGRLQQGEKRLVHQPYLLMRYRFPESGQDDNGPDESRSAEARDGLLIYCQMGITNTDPIEIQQIRHRFPKFPDEPTLNQFYTEDQVTAYRHLGYHIGNRVCSELERWSDRDFAVFSQDLSDVQKPGQRSDLDDKLGTEFFRDMKKIPDDLTESGRVQPGFETVRSRLLTGYRLTCFEEVTYDKDDILKEAVWKNSDEFAPVVLREFNRLLDCRNPMANFDYRWLGCYQRHADIRAAYRNAVLHDITGLAVTGTSEFFELFEILNHRMSSCLGVRNLDDDSMKQQYDEALISAHLSCMAVAAQEIHRGRPHSAFQIGGRDRLIQITRSLAGIVVRLMQESPSRSGSNAKKVAAAEADAEARRQLIRNSVCELAEMEHVVFHGAEFQTTISFAQCYIHSIAKFNPGPPRELKSKAATRRRKQLAGKNKTSSRIEPDESSDKPDESVMIRFREKMKLFFVKDQTWRIADLMIQYHDELRNRG